MFKSLYLHPVLKAYAALLGVTVFWGFTFPMVQWCLDDCSPVLLVTIRFVLAALLFPLFFGFSTMRVNRKQLWQGFVLGVFLCGGYIFQTFGLAETTTVRAGFITALYVPLTPIFAWLLFRAKIRRRLWLAALLAFGGIVILAIPEAGLNDTPLFNQLSLNRGDKLILGCAVSYALHILLINRWATPENEKPLSWIQLATTGVVAALLLPLDTIHFELTRTLVLSILFCSIFASIIAVWAMMRFQPRVPVTGAAIVYSMEPVMAGLAAWMMQNHVPPLLTVFGAIAIFAAMLIASTIHEPDVMHT
ncbi:MAG: DMT family transporter [bacterium]|nr:DMT family transporter [bacterium]